MKRLHELLYRLRNAYLANLNVIQSPIYSGWIEPLKILYDEGYIQNFYIKDNELYIYLRYYKNKPSIRKIINFTQPSRPLYLSAKDLWRFSRNNGVLLLSTNQGILSHTTCLKRGLGGKILFFLA
jgi:small subunit ribosomal protein S8